MVAFTNGTDTAEFSEPLRGGQGRELRQPPLAPIQWKSGLAFLCLAVLVVLVCTCVGILISRYFNLWAVLVTLGFSALVVVVMLSRTK